MAVAVSRLPTSPCGVCTWTRLPTIPAYATSDRVSKNCTITLRGSMPKAYDDESEFASEPAKELAQLSAWQRFRLLVTGKYLALSVGLVVGLISLASSLLSVTSTPPP